MAEGPVVAAGMHVNTFPTKVRKTVSHVNNVTAATNMRRRNRQRRTTQNRVMLERVLGITTSNGSGLTCDPNTGLVAYPAGCVVVLLHPKRNKQSHILNTSRKTFTALAFSQDGTFLVTGESGHMPCVRVWDVAARTQMAEVQCHKYGVACVAFSTNSSYIVSVGYQHDMTVSVWEWRKGTVIASNKVSNRVLSVSFSEDNSYFVTAGNRHIKFWYLDASKERRVNSTVPLIGRSGLLGEQRTSMFCGLACGRGNMASSTYCITSSGLLCQFNSRRMLDTWVDLKTSSAQCLSVSETYIFCGCADGTVRVFSPQNLHYITTLHRPHCLGVDIAQGVQPGHLFAANPEAEYPDTLALTFDPITRHLTCVYNDHSVYVWDVRDIKNVGKVYSALYHSGYVWSVETYPDMGELSQACLPPGSFLTCSSDNTIRLWHSDPLQSQGLGSSCLRNLYSHDLIKIVYVGENMQHLQSEGVRAEGGVMDGKSGIRVLGIDPDGRHLAAGDRNGNLRIFGLQFMDELLKIEAHDSEVLCLEFSPAETGLHLLASASRDRLIHIFNMEKCYSLEQTMYDHSASITAIKFTGVSPEVSMVSCGADKSIYFRTTERSSEGLNFTRTHHVVEKTTLCDMDLDATREHTAIACQDRNIRIYNVKSGKMTKCFKGSTSDDGTLLKVQMDPSGIYLATSCSDKNICIFDYESEDCVATLFGHSEIVTGMRFSQDCRHLITVSGDSCVFVWRLDSQMTKSMRKRLAERRQKAGVKKQQPTKQECIRRETYIAVPFSQLPQTEEAMIEEEDHRTPTFDFQDVDPTVLQTNGKLPMWARKLGLAPGTTALPVETNVGPHQPRGRWAEQWEPQAIRSVLLTRSLQPPLSPTPRRPERPEEEEQEDDPHFHPQSLDSLLREEEEVEENDTGSGTPLEHSVQRPDFVPLPDSEKLFAPGLSSPERSDYILYPANRTTLSTGGEGDFDVRVLGEDGRVQQHQRQGWGEEELSPDSACCVGSTESQDQPQDDTDSLSQMSSTGSSGEEEKPETLLRQHFDTMANNLASDEKFETDPQSLQLATENHFLNPRLSISTRFLSRFQSRIRVGPGHAPRLTALPPRNSEEPSSPSPSLCTTEVSSQQCSESCATESQEESHNSDEQPSKLMELRASSIHDLNSHQECKENFPPSAHPPVVHTTALTTIIPSSTEHTSSIQPPPHSPAPGNHSARAALHLDLSVPDRPALASMSPLSHKAQRRTVDSPCRPALVTPTEMRSLGKEAKRCISSSEENLAPREATKPFSLTPTKAPVAMLTETPTRCQSPGGPQVTGARKVGPLSQLQQFSPISGSVSPLSLGSAPPPGCLEEHSDSNTDSSDETVNLQICNQVVNDLRHTIRTAVSFYNKVCSMTDSLEQQSQMTVILKEAFAVAQSDLDSVCPEDSHSTCKTAHSPAEESPVHQLRDDRTVALLEKYSEMLIRITQKKIDCN